MNNSQLRLADGTTFLRNKTNSHAFKWHTSTAILPVIYEDRSHHLRVNTGDMPGINAVNKCIIYSHKIMHSNGWSR